MLSGKRLRALWHALPDVATRREGGPHPIRQTGGAGPERHRRLIFLGRRRSAQRPPGSRSSGVGGRAEEKTFDAHGAGASATAFRDKLQPLMIGGFGTRPHGGLSVAAPKAKPSPQAIFVLTHVDVFPAGKDQAVELVKTQVDPARKDDSNLRFDVLQWDGHPNHSNRDGGQSAARLCVSVARRPQRSELDVDLLQSLREIDRVEVGELIEQLLEARGCRKPRRGWS